MKKLPARGILFALCAYSLWGVLPIYWKLLKKAPALEILSHRVLWSLFFLLLLLILTRRFSLFRQEAAGIFRHPKKLAGVLACSVLISLNWLIYIWAVNDNRIVETSLGYYINPLVSVLFGIVFMKERLSARQFLAVSFAAAGVANLVLNFGSFPWIALTLAVSFALYGLLKKLLGLVATTGIILETMLISPLALIYLLFVQPPGSAVFGLAFPFETALLVASGIITALPMVLFASAANLLPLTVLGFFQYLAPTLALLAGVLLYHEPFTAVHAISFGLIWIGLAIFSRR